MRAQTKLLTMFAVFLAMLLPLAFADSPRNDTVNITVKIDTAPNITSVILDDFNDNLGEITLIAGANETVYCLVNATDYDGYAGLNQSTLNVSIYYGFYPSGYAASENPKTQYHLVWNDSSNLHACLNVTMGGGNESQGWIDYNCSISVPYYAENGTWTCAAQISDESMGKRLLASSNNGSAILQQLVALNISRDEIDFGFLALGDNQTRSDWNVSIENIGNVPLSTQVTATNMSDGTLADTYGMNCQTGYINETDIKFNDVSYQPYTGGAEGTNGWYSLTSGFTQQTVNMALIEATDDNKVFHTIFWGLNLKKSLVMTPQAKGECNGWLFFNAIIG